MLLEGKTLVVTAGNFGIGEAIVVAAAREGATWPFDCVVHPRNATADLQRMVSTAVDSVGRLDVLVNNAGIETCTSVLEISEADYDRVMAINLKSAFFGM